MHKLKQGSNLHDDEKLERAFMRSMLQSQKLVLRKIDFLHQQLTETRSEIMATLDEVLTDVTDESTKLDSLSAFIAGLKQQIADALAGATLPPATQAKIDAVFAQVETNKGKVQAALDANVPTP